MKPNRNFVSPPASTNQGFSITFLSLASAPASNFREYYSFSTNLLTITPTNYTYQSVLF